MKCVLPIKGATPILNSGATVVRAVVAATAARGRRIDPVPPFHQTVVRASTPRPHQKTVWFHPPDQQQQQQQQQQQPPLHATTATTVTISSLRKSCQYKGTTRRCHHHHHHHHCRGNTPASVREKAKPVRIKYGNGNNVSTTFGPKDGSMALAILTVQAEQLDAALLSNRRTTTIDVDDVTADSIGEIRSPPFTTASPRLPLPLECTAKLSSSSIAGPNTEHHVVTSLREPLALAPESTVTNVSHPHFDDDDAAVADATDVLRSRFAVKGDIHESGLTTMETTPPASTSVIIDKVPASDTAIAAFPIKDKEYNGVSKEAVSSSPLSLHEDSLELWNAYLIETLDQIAGYELNADNAFEPIPFHVLAGGVSIEADDDIASTAIRLEETTPATKKAASRPSSVIDMHGTNVLIKASTTTGTQNLSSSNVNSIEIESEQPQASMTKTKGQRSNELVGPESWQMMVIYRMVVYLQETKDCEHAHYMPTIRTIVAKCILCHVRGTPKYSHLPGSIFEALVEVMGGPAFLATYNASKTFHHPRLDDPSDLFQFRSKIDVYQAATTLEFSTFVKVAVGYGFHMAGMAARANTAERATSIQTLVEQGARLVLSMSEADRQSFYKNHVLMDSGPLPTSHRALHTASKPAST